MTTTAHPRYTFEEYLAHERQEKTRSTYLDGYIYPMAAESEAHSTIAANIAAEVNLCLKGTSCEGRIKDTKVRSGPQRSAVQRGLFSYPDILIFCDEVQYHDSFRDVIVNPKAVIEVLADSTAEFDRGEKFTRYRTWNSTLSDYVLVSQTEPLVEHFSRSEEGVWTSTVHQGPDKVVQLPALDLRLPLARIYDRVHFQ